MDNKKPNIVFVLTDDQGYGDLGCHGDHILKTPNIDAFHEDSIRFDNYHVGPTCAPTRAGLMCGHYANSTGVWHTVGGRSLLRGNEVTIGDVFSENGYQTGIFGKWHLGDNYPYRPQDRGFGTSVCHGGGGISQAPDYWGNDYFDDTYSVNGKPQKFDGYCTEVFFNQATEFIKKQQDNPFLCFVTPNAPHTPWNVEKKYSDLYKDKIKDIGRAQFYGMITNIDECFGNLIETLKELDIYDNTIVIFMTDNGSACVGDEANTCGLRGCKGSQYDGGHRVPFFINWTNGDLLSPRSINTLTSHIDVMPTLMDLCGIDLNGYDNLDFHGKSLKPLLTKEDTSWHKRTIVTDSQRIPNPIKWRQSAVMTDNWRLIDGMELYDINNDRGQTNDIADHYPEIVEVLRNEYDKWWDIVSLQMDEEIPISIGSENEKVTCLCSHDWRDPNRLHLTDPYMRENNDYLVWNQDQVRKGLGTNGYWEINVLFSGLYNIELRRWPKEENRAIVEGIPDTNKGWRADIILPKHKDLYSGGVPLPFETASLSICGKTYEKKISMEEAITFQVELSKGFTHLHTLFKGKNNLERGAYYVYINKI